MLLAPWAAAVNIANALIVPEDFGAIGDGTTDNQVALTNFLQQYLTAKRDFFRLSHIVILEY